nr:YjbQ family protein [Streptococcus ictaluri]
MKTVAARDSYHDITTLVAESIKESGIQTGICLIHSPHTTCSIFYEEYTHDDYNGDDYLSLDLSKKLEKMIEPHLSKDSYYYPGPKHYEAVEAWPHPEQWLPNGDKKALWNGDAHLKVILISSSQTVPISKGKLSFGKTGYLYFVDFDRTRERERFFQLTIMGE